MAPAQGAQQQCKSRDLKLGGKIKFFFGVDPKSLGNIKDI